MHKPDFFIRAVGGLHIAAVFPNAALDMGVQTPQVQSVLLSAPLDGHLLKFRAPALVCLQHSTGNERECMSVKFLPTMSQLSQSRGAAALPPFMLTTRPSAEDLAIRRDMVEELQRNMPRRAVRSLRLFAEPQASWHVLWPHTNLQCVGSKL